MDFAVFRETKSSSNRCCGRTIRTALIATRWPQPVTGGGINDKILQDKRRVGCNDEVASGHFQPVVSGRTKTHQPVGKEIEDHSRRHGKAARRNAPPPHRRTRQKIVNADINDRRAYSHTTKLEKLPGDRHAPGSPGPFKVDVPEEQPDAVQFPNRWQDCNQHEKERSVQQRSPVAIGTYSIVALAVI